MKKPIMAKTIAETINLARTIPVKNGPKKKPAIQKSRAIVPIKPN
ncbi:hypothetical protein [Winogradskyella psychrotolerans]|nr:hypothetical protein [Winogradskyella psychrotolerans]